VAVAAVALVAVLLWTPGSDTSARPGGEKPASVQTAAPAPKRLVEAWTAAELADVEESEAGFREFEPLNLEKFFNESGEPQERGVEVPDWLVAAVAAGLNEGDADAPQPPKEMN
jgi:hypothetical protein